MYDLGEFENKKNAQKKKRKIKVRDDGINKKLDQYLEENNAGVKKDLGSNP